MPHALIDALGGTEAVSRAMRVGVLVAARLAPVAVLAPWLAMRATPPWARAAITLTLTVALAPPAIASAASPPDDALAVTALVAHEALRGAVFAIASALPLYALDWAGRLVDTWRGASLAEVMAPPTGERTSPLGDLYLLMGVAIFAALGGHRLALGAFADALQQAPVGTVVPADALGPAAFGVARVVADALAFATALAAPAAVALVAVEVALGLVARVAPQVPVFFAGMPLRAAVGLAAALVALSVVVGGLPSAFRGAVAAAAALLHELSP